MIGFFIRNVSRKWGNRLLLYLPKTLTSGQETVNYKKILLQIDTGEEIGKRIYYYRSYEPDQEARLMELMKPGDIFFDIGANIGIFSLLAASCGAKVIAFEPSKKVYKLLRKNIEINNYQNSILTVSEAVSDRKGVTHFFETRSGNLGVGRIINFNPNDQKESYEVTINTLEYFVKKFGKPNVLKIDVEGAEYLILKGASNILKEMSSRILIEFHPKEIELFGGSIDECLCILAECGYKTTQGNKIDLERHSWEIFKKN